MQNQRVPADMVLVRTTEKAGSCFIRTDQLDGETDWKLRLAIPSTQRLSADQVHTHVYKKIVTFQVVFRMLNYTHVCQDDYLRRYCYLDNV